MLRARGQSADALSRTSGKRILVLCYGNIYRSPLVAHLLRKNKNLAGYAVHSAGFYEKVGRPCDGSYLEILKRRGYDLSEHRSSSTTREDLNAADLIIIMDRKNWDEVRKLAPSALSKTVWIGAFDPSGAVEVADPYGMAEQNIRKIIGQLEYDTECLAFKLSKKNMNDINC